MFAFLRQMMEERRRLIPFEPKPVETNGKTMNISKKFLEILQLSFEVKYLGKGKKKDIKIKALEERLDVSYYNVIRAPKDTKFDDIVALAAAYHNIGLIYGASMEVEELNTAVMAFSRCLELLQGKQGDPKAILTAIGALNELNLVCDKLKHKKYVFQFLNTALELYLKYTIEDDFPDPVHIGAVVDFKEGESNPRLLLDCFHYTTLQDLGIQYITMPKDKHAFVMYMHKILNIRLSEMKLGGVQFREKCLDWALTLYDISKYFLANNRFIEAKNHIAAGDYVTHRFCQDRLKPIQDSNAESQYVHLFESYDYVCGIRANCWGNYGVLLLRFWMEKFLYKEKDSCELDTSKLDIKQEESKLLFSDLEQEIENMDDQITSTCILNLTDAKLVFVQTLRYLDKAKEYFSAETDIESYAKIGLEISKTYKYLAGFEQQRDKQIKLHKRRVECLENVCKQFNTAVDVNTELQIYKRVWYEMVTSCSTVMDLMIEEAYNNESFKDTTMQVERFAKLISDKINLYLNI